MRINQLQTQQRIFILFVKLKFEYSSLVCERQLGYCCDCSILSYVATAANFTVSCLNLPSSAVEGIGADFVEYPISDIAKQFILLSKPVPLFHPGVLHLGGDAGE